MSSKLLHDRSRDPTSHLLERRIGLAGHGLDPTDKCGACAPSDWLATARDQPGLLGDSDLSNL